MNSPNTLKVQSLILSSYKDQKQVTHLQHTMAQYEHSHSKIPKSKTVTLSSKEQLGDSKAKMQQGKH